MVDHKTQTVELTQKDLRVIFNHLTSRARQLHQELLNCERAQARELIHKGSAPPTDLAEVLSYEFDHNARLLSKICPLMTRDQDLE